MCTKAAVQILSLPYIQAVKFFTIQGIDSEQAPRHQHKLELFRGGDTGSVPSEVLPGQGVIPEESPP